MCAFTLPKKFKLYLLLFWSINLIDEIILFFLFTVVKFRILSEDYSKVIIVHVSDRSKLDSG